VLRGRAELTLALPEPVHVDVEVALSMLHTAESAVAVAAWRRAWAPALSALFIAGRTFLPGTETPWAEAWRRRLADVRSAPSNATQSLPRAPESRVAGRGARRL
jgi:SARP family transcriptional regulator, regulator of embCAB operon